MPGYRKHLVGGAAAFGLTYAVLLLTKQAAPSMLTAGQWLCCALAGSLFPDIDVKSKGQNYFYWLIALLLIYFAYQRQLVPLAGLALAATIPMLVRHRGIFHNLWFIIGLAGVGVLLTMNYAPRYTHMIAFDLLFFVVGAASHLWLDIGFARMIRVR